MPLLKPDLIRDYQLDNIDFMGENDQVMLWLGCGLGKTIITLTDIVNKINADKVKKVLIFGPIRVIEAVWEREAKKWSHTKHLQFSLLRGTPQQRKRALYRKADIYLCNYENMNWLAELLLKEFKVFPFDYVVYDEITKVKDSTSMRVAGGTRDKTDKWGREYKINVTGWRKVIDKFKYRAGLTGTPASNGYLDLFGQFLVIDSGKRLGEYVTHYKDNYFANTPDGWGFVPTDSGKQMIESRISDITKKMDSADYLDLPAVRINEIYVDLPSKLLSQYREFEKEMFIEFEKETVEVFSGAAKSTKLLQFCNGNVYIDDVEEDLGVNRKYKVLHKLKLDALESILEEAGGSPVLCSYTFKSDAKEIMKRFKKYRPVNLTEEPTNKTESIINKWNEGKIKLLLAHPASAGHGIDGLQDSGSIIVWFGLNWSLELYEQLNARINRSGQKNPVVIHQILADNTIDLAVADALNRKHHGQEGLKAALQRYKDGYIKAGEVNFM